MSTAFQLGSGYVHHVINYSLGWHLPRQVSADNEKSLLLWNLQSGSVLGFLPLDNVHLGKFFLCEFQKLQLWLAHQVRIHCYSLCWEESELNHKHETQNLKMSVSMLQIKGYFFTFGNKVITFCCFKPNYCTHSFPLTQEIQKLTQIDSTLVL